MAWCISLGNPPSRIDILTTLKGLDFEICYTSRVKHPTFNIQLLTSNIQLPNRQPYYGITN